MNDLPAIELSFAVRPFFVVLLTAAAVALAFFFYRFTRPAVSRSRRILLSVLRGVALAVLLALICGPVLHVVFVTRHPPVVAILVDDTESMTMSDLAGNRADVIRHLVKDEIPHALPRGVFPRFHAFGASLGPPLDGPADTLSFSSEVTDIGAAFAALLRQPEGDDIRAVVLATDGVVTVGENPLHGAAALGVPVFTIGIGDSAEQRDLVLSRVNTNDLVYAGTSVPVDVGVKSSGYGGERVEVSVNDGPRILDRKSVLLPSGSGEISVPLAYTAGTEGVHHYAARVSALPGELTTVNNQRPFTVRILKSKIRVLVVAGEPGPDLSVIRQTLLEEKNFTVISRTQKSGGGYYEGALTSQECDSTDCLVTIGLPTSSTSAATVELLSGLIVRRKTPLLFIGGRNVDNTRLLTMAPSLPVIPERSSPAEQEVEFVPDPSQRINPLLTFSNASDVAPWSALPPLYATQTAYRSREGATVLGSPRLHSVVLPQPFIASRAIAETKSIAVLGYGLWRWRLMAQGNPATAPFLQQFLSTSVMWLVSRDIGRGVRAGPLKDEFSLGEKVDFAAQVYDATAKPVENAVVHLSITGTSGQMETDLRPVGNGRYEGTVEGLPKAEYRFEASASVEGTVMGRDKGSFTVGGLALEFMETRMNADLLRQIAYRTGGRFFAATEAVGLREALDSVKTFAPREERRSDTIELPHWGTMLAILVILLAAEWTIRKRSGML